MANLVGDSPSELFAVATKLAWAPNTNDSANRVIPTKGLLFYSGGGIGSDLPVAGSAARGVTQLSVAPATTGAPIALGANDPRGVPQVSAALPSSPVDGQLWIYRGSSFAWQFMYNAGSASALKWEFIGGGALTSVVATSESTSSTTYAALTTAGPSVALPFAGDYEIIIGCTASNSASGSSDCVMSYDIGATGAVDADAVKSVAGTSTVTMERTAIKTGLTAVTLTAKYKTVTGGTATFANRYISVRPVRVG